MNPFKEEAFSKYWSTKSKEVWEQQEAIVKKTPPTLEQVVEFVADADKVKTVIDKLYFVYQAPYLTDPIGWSKQPSVNGIGGYLDLGFYERLLKQLDTPFQIGLYPYLPGDVQEKHEDLFLAYLENPGDGSGSPRNYKGDKKPSDKVLNWMLDNRIGTIKDWEPEWWTPKLKTKAVAREPFAISFIPEDLLTKAEIRNYLRDYGKDNSRYMHQFWKNIPESYKKDPTIFAMWLISIGGLKDQYRNLFSTEYFTLEGMKLYFQFIQSNAYGDWKLMKSEWKDELLPIALEKANNAIANDLDVELTDELITKLVELPMIDARAAEFAKRLSDEGKLTPEIITKLDLNWWGLDNLPSKDLKKLLKDQPEIVDHLVSKKDKEFLSKKTNWPAGVEMTKEHFFDIIIGLNFSYTKIKARIQTRFTEDDFVWLWLEANKWTDVKSIRHTLERLEKDGYVTGMTQETLDLLEQLGKDATFEAYKNATDIFMF